MRRLSIALVLLLLPAGWAGTSWSTPCESSDGCGVVRPGARFDAPEAVASGTVGFLLRGSDHRVYLVTSGSCGPADERDSVRKDEGPPVERTWRRYEPLAYVDGHKVGRIVYQHLDGYDLSDPFADASVTVVRLDRGIHYDGEVRILGGPTRLMTGLRPDVTQVQLVGQGRAVEGQARDGVLPHGVNKDLIVHGALITAPGDAGAPILGGDGEAIGIDIGKSVGMTDFPVGEVYAGSYFLRLPPVLARVGKVLGIRLTLLTG